MDNEAMPTTDELGFWWNCYRKIGYVSSAGAVRANSAYEKSPNVPYRCEYGDHWHLGKPRTSESWRSTNRPASLRKMWKRTRVKPTLEELSTAFQAKRPRVLRDN
jgi:hypothetical protein